jgi:diguanylate cyclase (GGDEF)-like protein/PAS domain S-box-containing protein
LGKGFYVKYIIATVCLVIVFAVAIAHSNYMEKKIANVSRVYLSKITSQNADIVSSQIRNNLQSLDIIARVIGSGEKFSLDEVNDLLQTESNNSNFISMGVVLVDGTIAFTPISSDYVSDAGTASDSAIAQTDGRKLLTSADWEYINKTMSGFSGLSGGPSRIINGETVNIYALQLYRDRVVGALVVFFNEDFFQNMILPETLAENGCSYVADDRGTIIFASENAASNPLFEKMIPTLANGWSLKGEAGAKLRADIRDGGRDTVEYSTNDKDVYISYVPIGFKDWYLISLTETSAAEEQSKSLYDDVFRPLIYILLMVLALSMYLVYMRSQRLRRFEQKMHVESIQDESYRIIMEQTDDIIFEYDTIDKTYFHTTNFQKNFGYEPTRTGFLGSLESDYVHPDDVIRFAELYEKMKRDRRLAEAEVRIINSEGEYLWTRIHMLGVFDQEGKLAKVIGKIVNIDEKKRELQYLKERAVTDSATGVFNKQTTEESIISYLSGEGKHGKHAMLMIDIDDFKGINDYYGHRIGDEVIASLGAELNRIFRSSDIKGRVGGDEFMVLMKDIEEEGREFIADKANAICKMFKHHKLDENKWIDFSASIGIAFYDMDGSTYEELYEAADRALYNVKNEKKGSYAFCTETDLKTSSKK